MMQISGKNLHKSKGNFAKVPAPKQFQMLIDVQAKMAEGKTIGYEKWAKKFNRKEAARTVILLKEKGLGNYDDLTAHIENLTARFDALSDSIKAAEKRMVEVQALQQHIKNYRNTRQIYIEYRKSGYKSYYYISDDDTIEVGDFVIVPAGKDNHEAVVEVVKKEYFAEENVPLPMEKTKHIIRKCTDADFDLPDDKPV